MTKEHKSLCIRAWHPDQSRSAKDIILWQKARAKATSEGAHLAAAICALAVPATRETLTEAERAAADEALLPIDNLKDLMTDMALRVRDALNVVRIKRYASRTKLMTSRPFGPRPLAACWNG